MGNTGGYIKPGVIHNFWLESQTQVCSMICGGIGLWKCENLVRADPGLTYPLDFHVWLKSKTIPNFQLGVRSKLLNEIRGHWLVEI